MRLKEESIFVRWATPADVLGDGRLHAWLQHAAERLGGAWTARRDLAVARPRTLQDAALFLEGLEGAGFHQRHRVEIESASTHLRFRLDAGPHPYTGEWTVRGDLRARRAMVCGGDPAELSGAVDALVRAAAIELEPWMVHAHDVDDSVIQNLEGEGMLRLGYGVESTSLPALEDRPGREWNRGALRFAAEWRTWYDFATLETLAEQGEELEGEPVGKGQLFSLGAICPSEPDAHFREEQWALRESLGLARIASRMSRTWGYWDKKSRGSRVSRQGGES